MWILNKQIACFSLYIECRKNKRIQLDGLVLCFLVVAGIQVFYFLFFFSRLAFYKPQNISGGVPKVSVVICARNEAENLKKNLPRVLEQDFPEFEVIVVNDNSEDETALLLEKMNAHYQHLVVRNLVQDSHAMKGKKYPLTVGVRAARYEVIAVTDADCVPSSSYWLRNLTAPFNSDMNEVVLGYAPFKKYPGFLNRFIRFETFFTGLQYLSYALAHVPYMGVGRNMGYRKKLFFENNVFPKFSDLLSGDDDLFINAAANSSNTTIAISKEAFMYSEPKKVWEEYWFQKQRHVSSGRYYKFHHRFLLGLFSFTHLMFYPISLLVMLYSQWYLFAFGILFFRWLVIGVVYLNSMRKLGEEDLFIFFPVLDILFLIYYLKLLPDLFGTNRTTWK